jgi:sRNA-binding protein
VPAGEHEAFLRSVAETQERLALDLERAGSVEYAHRAWARAAAARERADAAQRRRQRGEWPPARVASGAR